MSQTYRIGSLSFTGSQAILSASLDVSGSGRFTDGLTVTGSFTVITGSSREFQVRNTGVDIGNIITDTHTVTGSLNISGSITGSLFGTASFALATAAAPASDRIIAGNITASVSTTGDIFTVASSSVNLMTVNSSGIVTIATSGSANTMRLYVLGGLYPIIETLSGFEVILRSSGQDRLKVGDNVTTNVPLRFGTPPGGATVSLIRPGTSTRFIDMQLVAGLSGSVRGDILIQSGSLIAQGGEFRITTGSTDYLRVFPSTGNTFIGSTPVDGGFKLEVAGTTRLGGSTSLSIPDWTLADSVGIFRMSISTIATRIFGVGGDSTISVFNRPTSTQPGFLFSTVTTNTNTVSSRFSTTYIGSFPGITSQSLLELTATGSVVGSSGSLTYLRINPNQMIGFASDIAIETVRGDVMLGTSGTGSVYIGTSTTSSFKLDVSGSGRFTDGLTVTGSVNISSVINLSLSNPLPTGTTGSLAASGSSLYFHDGSNWRQVSLL